jgi:Asp-tRNA(Asn)/Glu-tRNA(Gln) amidotransferase A subunit family amidase
MAEPDVTVFVARDEAGRHCRLGALKDHGAERRTRRANGQGLRRARAEGRGGPLEGIPLGIKDLFAPRACTPRPAATSSTASSRNTNRP